MLVMIGVVLAVVRPRAGAIGLAAKYGTRNVDWFFGDFLADCGVLDFILFVLIVSAHIYRLACG